MKWTLLFLFILTGCNSKQSELTSIQGLRDPADAFPIITSVSVPDSKTYLEAENLEIDVTFSETVEVIGTPVFPIQLDSGFVYANYISGSGSNVLRFVFSVQNGSWDANGIIYTGNLLLGIGGSIYNLDDDDDAILTYTKPDTSGIKVDAIEMPAFQALLPPANGYYKQNSNLDFTVQYDGPVIVTGFPRIQLNIAGTTQYAMYVSGSGSSSLVFRYVVPAGIEDIDGIVISSGSISANGGALNDPFGIAVGLMITPGPLPLVLVDSIKPTISGQISVPPTAKTYYPGELLYFPVNFSENVQILSGNPRIRLTLDNGTTYADFDNTSNSTINYKYVVASGQLDPTGLVVVTTLDMNSAVIADLAGNIYEPAPFTVPSTTHIKIDGVAPSITSVNVAIPGASPHLYRKDDVISIHAFFTTQARCSNLNHYIQINIGGVTKQARCSATTMMNPLIFNYTLEADLVDNDGIAVISPVMLVGGTIKDGTAGNANDAILMFTNLIDTDARVNSFVYLKTITLPNGERAYSPGEAVDFVATFDRAITTDATGKIVVKAGATTINAVQVAHVGASLTFRFNPAPAHFDLDGIEFEPRQIVGGNIRDGLSNLADINFPAAFTPQIYLRPSALSNWYDFSDYNYLTVVNPSRISQSRNKAADNSHATLAPVNRPVWEDEGVGYGARFEQPVPFSYGSLLAAHVVIVYKAPSPQLGRMIDLGSTYLEMKPSREMATGCQFCEHFDGNIWHQTIFNATYGYVLDPFISNDGEKRIISMDIVNNFANTFIGPSFVGGTIYEVIIFSTDPSEPDLIKVHDYLKAKHNVDF